MADKNATTAQGANPKTPWLLITLIVLIFLLATGAAIGGTWLYLSGSSGGSHTTEQSEPKPPPKPVYVKVDPFTVNLNDERGRILYVKLSLKVNDKHVAENIEQHMPQVRNRILFVLTTQQADALTTLKGKEALALDLREAVSKPFREGEDSLGIETVLFTDFIVQ